MPWLPELFSAPALQRMLDERRHEPVIVPFFDGLLAGEPDALVRSFAGEPQVHDPIDGRIKGEPAFRAFVARTSAWLAQHHVTVEDVERVVLEERGFEEVILHFDGDAGRDELPLALVADHPRDGRIEEVRLYYRRRPLTGRDGSRPPLLQADPGLREPDVVGEYQRALAAGDADAIAAAFEPDGYVREPTGGEHRGPDALRAFHRHGGGIALEPCALVDDGRACALEYNVLPSQAGLAVHVRGPSGRLAAVRLYDDVKR